MQPPLPRPLNSVGPKRSYIYTPNLNSFLGNLRLSILVSLAKRGKTFVFQPYGAAVIRRETPSLSKCFRGSEYRSTTITKSRNRHSLQFCPFATLPLVSCSNAFLKWYISGSPQAVKPRIPAERRFDHQYNRAVT